MVFPKYSAAGMILATDWDDFVLAMVAHAARHENAGVDEISVAGLSGLLADVQNPVVHGAAQHTDVTRELFVPIFNDVDAGATLSFNWKFTTVTIVDGDGNTYFSFTVPDDFVSFTSIEIIWICGAAAGNMYWNLYGTYGASGEARNTHIDAPGSGVTATGGANIINIQEAANALTMAALALGDVVGVQFQRVADASDTLNTTVDIVGLLFTYTGHQ